MKKKINKNSVTGRFASNQEIKENPAGTYSQTVDHDYKTHAELLWKELGHLLANLNQSHLDESELLAFKQASATRKLISKAWYGPEVGK